ncbi:MAG: sodium/solute symporter [Oscillospiraceae bacterium]|nr:sodium/solute symporter [Oscillospiraceae bacterium]
MVAKISMLVFFVAVTVLIAVVCRKRDAGVSEFVLGGRSVGPWLTAFSYGTAYFSAVVFVGYAGQFGWNFGVSATWIGLGNAFIGSLMAWMILGRRTRVMTKHLESATMPDFFAKRFDSHALRIVTSVIIFVFLIPYSASVYKGQSGLFSLSFHLDYTYCIIGVALLTGLYVVVGGYMATAFNDLFQGIIMLIGIVAVVVAVLSKNGGLTDSLNALSQIPCETAPNLQGAFTSFFGPNMVELASVVVLTSLGTWGLPQMVHKFYTIKSERSIKAGTVISTAFALIIAGGSYFLGGFGRLFYTPNGNVVFDEIIPTMLAESLPDLLIGLVLILVLSASMSTLASLVMTSSSTFTLDFLKGALFPNMNSKAQVLVIRVLCAFFVLLSVVIALNPSNLITSLMSLSWGTLAGCFLGPFIYGLYWKRTTRASVWVTLITGVGINVANLFGAWVSPTVAGAASMILSLVLVPVVSLVTPKLSEGHVSNLFSCYTVKAEVEQKYAIDEK